MSQSQESEPQRIGGWLFLVALGMTVAPFRQLIAMQETFSLLLAEDALAVLLPLSPHFMPGMALVTGFEVLFQAGLLVATGMMTFLFFRKDYRFPRFFIATFVGSVVFVFLDHGLCLLVFPDSLQVDPIDWRSVMSAATVAAVWVPYMLLSKRAKATFVRNLPRAGPDETIALAAGS